VGILQDIRTELVQNIDEHTRNTAQRFFKEKVKVHGVMTGTVTKIAKKYFSQVRGRDKKDIFSLCEELFSSGYMEESSIACNWSYWIHERFEEKDLRIFEAWLDKFINNWASCDTLSNHTLGAFFEKYPGRVIELKRWAKSGNMWKRRAAAVSLIIPARRGGFLSDAFEISDILMDDSEDLVQKGYGWLLKEESRNHQKAVFQYVQSNKRRMPRTAFRYAVERMPEELRKKAMEK